MVAGGKPLWYLELFTTFSTFFLTIFFLWVCLSWSAGISKIVQNPKTELEFYPETNRGKLAKNCSDFLSVLKGGTFYVNLAVGSIVISLGSAMGYLMMREKTNVLYSKIWFGAISSYTLVWMVTSIVFFTEVEELASAIGKNVEHVKPPLTTIYKWGHENKGSTVVGLVVAPTSIFLFLSFVAYRLYAKIEVFGNQNPERIATENTPGSWFERQGGAEGGTWEREPPNFGGEARQSLVKAQVMNVDGATESNRPIVQFSPDPQTNNDDAMVDIVQESAPLENKPLRSDSHTAGLGTWLEDIFDYTF